MKQQKPKEGTKSIKINCFGAIKVDVDEVNPLQGNLKSLSKTKFEKLKSLILNQGFSFPLKIWRDNHQKNWLIGGHQTLRVLKELRKEGFDIPKLPASLVVAENKKDAQKKVLSDASVFGEIDYDGLYEYLEQSEIDLKELDNFDFPDFDTEGMQKAESMGEVEGQDDVPEVPKDDKRVKTGDLFLLGDHRLLCGDSTDKEQVERLMDGNKADMVFTDPPYGVSVVQNNMVGSDFGVAPKGRFKSVVGDNSTEWAQKFYELCLIMEMDNIILWGGNYFTDFLPSMNSWIVWNKRGDTSIKNTFADGELAWSSLGHPVRIYSQLWNGMIREGERDKRVHPTQKPISLAEFCFDLKKEVLSVLDGFGGSGSTLIACEKTNRKCFMMEIDPHYCAVILDRWAKFTGKDPIREKDQKPWSKIKS